MKTILRTKLIPPPPPQNSVARPHLLNRLSAGLAGKVTVVSAPAGFGKSTLVSQFGQSQTSHQLAWLSLDSRDDEFGRWLRYVVAALEPIAPGVGETVLPLLATSTQTESESLLIPLLNTLAELNQPILLVLDDYHVLTQSDIHQALAFLLNHWPPGHHLALTSRHAPPLPLPRLRIRGQLTEIGPTELAFSPTEAAAFVQGATGFNLSETQATTLTARLEGWAAGLKIAALSLKKHAHSPQASQEVAQSLLDLSGGHRHLFDYLVQEVLSQQDPALRQFLTQTAILDRFNASLCQAVTGQSETQATLERLEAANLFLIPLDNERQWYRYHHLFADFLRQYAAQNETDLPTLHQRASRWFAEHNLLEEAIHHAFEAEEFEQAARLLKPVVNKVFWSREHNWLHQQIERLPAAIIPDHPQLYLSLIWAKLSMGAEPESVAAYWAILEQNRVPAMAQEIKASRLVYDALQARNDGQLEKAMSLSRQALDLLDESARSPVRFFVYFNLSQILMLQGDIRAAERASLEVLEAVDPDENMYIYLLAHQQIAELNFVYGKFSTALEMCQAALAEFEARHTADSPLLGVLYPVMGRIYLEQARFAEAEHYYQRAMVAGEQSQLLDVLFPTYAGQPILALLQGKTTVTASWLNRIRQMFQGYNFSLVEAEFDRFASQTHFYQGNLAAVSAWVAQYGYQLDDEFNHSYEDQTYILLAHYSLIQAQRTPQVDSEALQNVEALLDRLLGADMYQTHSYRQVQFLCLKALTQQTQQQLAEAISTLRQALSLAEPRNLRLRFLLGGEAMRDLLQAVVARDSEASFAQSLLADFAALPGFVPPYPPPRPAEPDSPAEALLTEREREILHLLAQGLSTRQAAERLFLSPGTVKWHVNNIYSKLHVHKRVNALRKARELGLIS